LLAGRVEIEIGDQDPAPMSRGKVEQGRTLNGVVSDFHSPAIFEDKQSGLQRRIGINRGRVGLGPFRSTRRSSLFHGRNVGAFALSTAIKYGRSTLIVSVVLSIIITSLLLVGSVSGIVVAVGHRDRIPDGPIDAGIITMMMAVVVPVSLVAIVAIVTVMAIVNAVIRDESRTGNRCVASWSHRCSAGRRTVDGSSPKTG
jgi:hypothetical protein